MSGVSCIYIFECNLSWWYISNMNAIQANLIQNNFQVKRRKIMFVEYGSIKLGARPSADTMLTEQLVMFIGFSMIRHHLGGLYGITLHWRHNERHGVSNHQPRDCLLNRLFWCRSKKTSKLRVTDLCEGNSSVTGEFPTQRSSNAENVSIWWRHHDLKYPTRSREIYLHSGC